MRLHEILQSLELDKNEIRIFEFLLHHAESSASRIASILSLKRTTVYSALDRLTERGIVTYVTRDAYKSFSIIPPETLPRVLRTRAERRYKDACSISDELAVLLKEQTLQDRSYAISGFKVRRVESIDAVYGLLREMLEEGGFSAIFNPQCALQGDAVKIVERFLIASTKTKPTIRELYVDGPLAEWYTARVRNPHHHLRKLPLSLYAFQSDLIIRGEKVLVTNYKGKASRAQSLLIEERTFAESLMAMFEIIWKCAECARASNPP